MDAEIISTIIKCTNFAAIKHRNQKRLDPEQTPYINHPIGVAYILTSEAQITDLDVIQAALLHDTVEDTDTTLNEIEEIFGKNVRNIVNEVTDDKSLPKNVRKQLQIKNAKNSTHEAKLVKLADKLYNLRSLQQAIPIGWTDDRVREYFIWSKNVVNNLIGTNLILEKALADIFNKEINEL